MSLAALAAGGGHGGIDKAIGDHSKGASAGDPNPISETTAPVFGGAEPASAESISPEVAKGILAEFQRAQSSELKALEHRNKLELKELKASQSARQKEWEKHEKDARHRFFSEHTRGPDRRAYIRDFMDRRRAFLQLLVEEGKQRSHEQDVRTSSLKEDQTARLKEFQEALKRNQRPPARLWPGAG